MFVCVYTGIREGMRRDLEGFLEPNYHRSLCLFPPIRGMIARLLSLFFFLINFRYFSFQGWKRNLCTSSFIITYGYGPLIVIITGAHLPRRILYLRLFYFSLIFFWEYRIFFDIVKITLLRFSNLFAPHSIKNNGALLSFLLLLLPEQMKFQSRSKPT